MCLQTKTQRGNLTRVGELSKLAGHQSSSALRGAGTWTDWQRGKCGQQGYHTVHDGYTKDIQAPYFESELDYPDSGKLDSLLDPGMVKAAKSGRWDEVTFYATTDFTKDFHETARRHQAGHSFQLGVETGHGHGARDLATRIHGDDVLGGVFDKGYNAGAQAALKHVQDIVRNQNADGVYNAQLPTRHYQRAKNQTVGQAHGQIFNAADDLNPWPIAQEMVGTHLADFDTDELGEDGEALTVDLHKRRLQDLDFGYGSSELSSSA